MNIYTIYKSKDYPREAELLKHLKKEVSEYSTYIFIDREDDLKMPRCERAEVDPSLTARDTVTNELVGDGGLRQVNEEIRRFEDNQ